MNAIPEFETKDRYPFAVLPDGVYPCDEEQFQLRFVEDFPNSQTRKEICDGYFLLRKEAIKYGIIATQWVDGSFVEKKNDPGDVDVVTFCDYDFLNNLDNETKNFIEEKLYGGETTKKQYKTHTFLETTCPRNHPYYPTFEKSRKYWRFWFGKTRDISNPSGDNLPGYAKGFIQMALGDFTLAPQISHERSES